MEFVATLLLFALTAVGAEPPYLNDFVTPGNCSDFSAEAWMEFLPKPLELNVQYELAPEAEEIPDYTEPLHVSDPDYDPLDSESTDDDDTEHLGELVRRRREVGNESSVDSTATPVSALNETRSANASDNENLEQVPLAMLRLKKYKNKKIVLPNQPNKVMLKNFQKAKMSFFLTFESHDAEACGVGSISSDHYFKKLQGCWLEHKHKAHEICRQKHGKRFGWHGRHHRGRGRHSESHDHSDEEHSVTGLQDDANGTVSGTVNGSDLNAIHTLDESINEILTDGHDDHNDGHDDHNDGHDDHDDGHDDLDDGRDSHDDGHDHHDRHHHGRRPGGRGHRHHHHHHGHDDNDDRGRHGGRGHHHHHDHDDHDDRVQLDDVSATSTVPVSMHSHDFVPAEGEVLTCDNAMEGWMEPESKLVLQYVTPGCGCFEINVHVSFPTDSNSSLVLTPEANEEYLHIYECVDSHTSEEDSGENYPAADMDGIDAANIIDDDSDENRDDKPDDEEEDNSHENDGDNAIDSDEATYTGNERGLIKRKLRNRTIRIWEDNDDDDDDDGDDEEDDDDEDAGVSRRSSRRRRTPEEEADQQGVDRREERRRRRLENQRRREERRRSRGRGNEADQTGDVAANTVDTGDTQAARQERRRLRQQRRQERRQQQGNGNRRGRGRGNRRRGNTEDGDEASEASGDGDEVEPLAEAVHGASNRAITRLNRRRNRNLQRYRNSARRANRLLLRSTVGFGPRFCCKQGIQHKKASFFPDSTGARADLACEDVPNEVPMWGNHKHGVQADECVRLYTSCCQDFSLNQWKDWFTSPSPRDDDDDDGVASTPATNATELHASQEQL